MEINYLKTEAETISKMPCISYISQQDSRNMFLYMRWWRKRPVVNIKTFLCYSLLILYCHLHSPKWLVDRNCIYGAMCFRQCTKSYGTFVQYKTTYFYITPCKTNYIHIKCVYIANMPFFPACPMIDAALLLAIFTSHAIILLQYNVQDYKLKLVLLHLPCITLLLSGTCKFYTCYQCGFKSKISMRRGSTSFGLTSRYTRTWSSLRRWSSEIFWISLRKTERASQPAYTLSR